MSTPVYALDVPDCRLTNYANVRMHYMKEHRDKKAVAHVVRTYGMRLGNTTPLPKAHVRITVTKPRTVTAYTRKGQERVLPVPLWDQDGLECALKPVYDSLKGWLIVDDSTKHITRENVQQYGEGWNVRIEVYSREFRAGVDR